MPKINVIGYWRHVTFRLRVLHLWQIFASYEESIGYSVRT